MGFKKNLKESLIHTLYEADRLFHSDQDIAGLSTSIDELDKMTSGFKNGELIIVAGRPGMGKSAFAMSCALHSAIIKRKAIAWFGLEMPIEQLTMRMLSSTSKIDIDRIINGQLLEGEWGKLNKAINELEKSHIYIDDLNTSHVNQVSGKAREINQIALRELIKDPKYSGSHQQGVGLIVVDYLQLINEDSKTSSRSAKAVKILSTLKSLAVELNVPIMVLSQLNRKLDYRSDKRPILADLDSAEIEMYGDLILALYREEYYDPDTPYRGYADISVLKQRNGPLGTVVTIFNGSYLTFENFKNEETNGY